MQVALAPSGYSGMPLPAKLDLVDVKVAAIDATWSGPKPVIRKEPRH